MSNKMKRRPKRAAHVSPGGPTDLDALAETVGPIYDEVVVALAQARTALDAELTVADLLHAVDAGAPYDVGADERTAVLVTVTAGLAMCAAGSCDPSGLALLRALAVVGPEPAREVLAEATDRILAAGVQDPRWAEGIGRATPVRAWVHGDIWGQQETLAVVFDQGGREHVAMVLLDHGLGGGVKDTWFAEDVTAVEHQLQAAAASSRATELDELRLDEARELLALALERPECPADPDQAADVATHRALLRHRLQAWDLQDGDAARVPDGTVATIKVDLRGAKPPIWRRLEVPADITLETLHATIQVAFGWDDTHLHQFSGRRRRYADPAHDLEQTRDETSVPLLRALEDGRLTYSYDFGDDWEHRIVLEGLQPPAPGVAYPRCTGGRRAAPPDDIGGIWRYSRLVAAAADSSDPGRAEAVDELAGWGVRAPARFESDTVTRALRPLALVLTPGLNGAGPTIPRPARPRRPARSGGTAPMW